MFGIGVIWLLGGVSACASGGGPVEKRHLPALQGIRAGVTLEWHDLDAAVSYMARESSLAIVDAETVRVVSDGGAERAVRLYRLIDVQDRPIEIRFESDPGALGGGAAAEATREGSVVVRVGRFGDDQRERELVAGLMERLAVLREID